MKSNKMKLKNSSNVYSGTFMSSLQLVSVLCTLFLFYSCKVTILFSINSTIVLIDTYFETFLRENSTQKGVQQITEFQLLVIVYIVNTVIKKIKLLLNSNYLHRRIHGITISMLPYRNFSYVLK